MPRILLVDDAPPILILLSRLLTEQGHEIATARNGKEAVQLLEKGEFDLMISDLNMRPVNGAELLRKTRESYPKMGVVLLTAYESMYTADEAKKNGAFAYIVKPFKSEALLQTVQRALDHYVVPA